MVYFHDYDDLMGFLNETRAFNRNFCFVVWIVDCFVRMEYRGRYKTKHFNILGRVNSGRTI